MAARRTYRPSGRPAMLLQVAAGPGRPLWSTGDGDEMRQGTDVTPANSHTKTRARRESECMLTE